MANFRKNQTNNNGNFFKTPQAFNRGIKNICDIMRRSNCAGAMQYIPELTWILFLRILDQQESIEASNAEVMGFEFTPTLISPYRWKDWGAPSGGKRIELQMSSIGSLFNFVNEELIPTLKNPKYQSQIYPRQRIISKIMAKVERINIDTESNLIKLLDQVHKITIENVDTTHIFPLSQIYEGLLLKMGDKSNDGGQFFTPREIIRVMVRVIAPKIGETVYDPCCGTGGFLAQSYEFMREFAGDISLEEIETLKRYTFYGREKENLIYPISLANLVLHGIDDPHIFHGNTLTGQIFDDCLFQGSPEQFDVILTNPPFGGKEGKDVHSNFTFKTSSTQILFLQHIIDSLKPGGRCGIVVDEGVLFRTNETAFVQTKRKLLEKCNLWCIVSLPIGVFLNAGTSLKTNLLFFTKGKPTKNIWYYDLSDIKISKKTPLTFDKFSDLFQLLQSQGSSVRSWTVSDQEIHARGYDLKAVNPNKIWRNSSRRREELLDLIEAKSNEIDEALAVFKQ